MQTIKLSIAIQYPSGKVIDYVNNRSTIEALELEQFSSDDGASFLSEGTKFTMNGTRYIVKKINLKFYNRDVANSEDIDVKSFVTVEEFNN